MTDQPGGGPIPPVDQPPVATPGAPQPTADGDLWAPVFFLSYAHAERNRRVLKFFNDLSENVGHLVSRPTGADPGYMDHSIEGGTDWSDELLGAIGTCQVFVALLCAPYYASVWCSMEWYAFSRRTVINRTTGQPVGRTAIIPVVWAPVPDGQVPPTAGRLQRFAPDSMRKTNISAQYKEHGVFGLLQMRRDVAYQGVVWQLAQHIANFHYSYLTEPRTLKEHDLRDIFRELGP